MADRCHGPHAKVMFWMIYLKSFVHKRTRVVKIRGIFKESLSVILTLRFKPPSFLPLFFILSLQDVLCPAQLQLDHGDFWPRDQWLRVGATQSFSCQEGFTLYGSAQRNCTLSGEWTGSTPVCDNHGEHRQHSKTGSQ